MSRDPLESVQFNAGGHERPIPITLDKLENGMRVHIDWTLLDNVRNTKFLEGNVGDLQKLPKGEMDDGAPIIEYSGLIKSRLRGHKPFKITVPTDYDTYRIEIVKLYDKDVS